MWVYSVLYSRANLAPLQWSDPLSPNSECPGCSVRTFHSGHLEPRTSLSCVGSWSYSTYSASVFLSLTSWSFILCMWNIEFSKRPKETPLQICSILYATPSSLVLCSLNLLQPSWPPVSLFLSSTLQGCQPLFGICSIPCELEFVSRQKAGAILRLTSFVSLLPGITALYNVQK